MTIQTLERQVEHRLLGQEVRYTRGRRQVVAALAAADGPRSAAELHDELRTDVPLSSLYRSLAVLEDAGILAPHYSTKGVTRYELAEWLTGHHHHLVCVDCGTVEDVELSAKLEAELHSIVKKMGAHARFKATDHTLELEGVCARCA